MPRFALSIHNSPRGLHYDFFLEAGEVLKTWALPRLPEAGLEIPCEALADHRTIYLDYEGPISDGRGTVARWDQGTYSIELWSDDESVVELAGGKLTGRVELRRLEGQWRFKWKREVRPGMDDRLRPQTSFFRFLHSWLKHLEVLLFDAISVVPATINAPSSKRIVSMWMICLRSPRTDVILIKATGSPSACRQRMSTFDFWAASVILSSTVRNDQGIAPSRALWTRSPTTSSDSTKALT